MKRDVLALLIPFTGILVCCCGAPEALNARNKRGAENSLDGYFHHPQNPDDDIDWLKDEYSVPNAPQVPATDAEDSMFDPRTRRPSASAFFGSRGKRLSYDAFLGSRGKRLSSEWFMGSRGKRLNSMAFLGSRGRRDQNAFGSYLSPYAFRPRRIDPSKFFGSRGKRYSETDSDSKDIERLVQLLLEYETNQKTDKRQPHFGFHGSRGKRDASDS